MKRLFTLFIIFSFVMIFNFTSCKKSTKGNITVGAKNFTEQYVIGNMISLLLKENGFTTTEKFGTGSKITRDGLTTKQIDLYPEYTGTAWTVYLNNKDVIQDAHKLYQMVKKQDMEKNNIVWLDRFQLNNTYALAIKQEKSGKYGDSISDLSDYIKNNGQIKFGINHEFFERPDGFFKMAEEYGMNVDKNMIKTMNIGISYEALDRNQVEVAMVFSTDGLLKKYNLKVLDDDKHFFPVYNICIIANKDIIEKYPEISEILKPLSQLLDNETIQNLNFKVDAENIPAKMVAQDFLKQKNLIK